MTLRSPFRGGTAGRAERRPARAETEWLVLAYLAGDSSAGGSAVAYLNSLESRPHSDQVAVVAELDLGVAERGELSVGAARYVVAAGDR